MNLNPFRFEAERANKALAIALVVIGFATLILLAVLELRGWQ